MLRIYIVDDHPLVIEGIRALLENEPEIEWKGHALSAAQCLSYFKYHTCDVILMDIALPDMSGIDLCREIKKKHPSIQILGLSTFNQGSYIAKMLESGASGYVVKSTDKNELLKAIETVAAGKKYMSFEVENALRINQQYQNQFPVLTKREKEVLRLISEGFTNPQISDKLFISLETVCSHRKNLLAKIKVNNTAALIRFAIANELL